MKRIFPAIFALLLVPAAYGQSPGGGSPGGFPGGGFSGRGAGSPGTGDAVIRSDMAVMELDGFIPLRFANALNGEPVSGAAVAVDGVGAFTTDARGIVQIPRQRLPDGNYHLTFSKDGFITTPIDFPVQVGKVVFNWFSVSPGFSVPPEPESRAYRFVLDWGERPEDLDIHLEKRGGYHISYSNMHTAADGSANLDRDDRNSYGPETITVSRAENGAVYSLYVVDYTNLSRGGASDSLGRSGATVRVYSENRLVNTFTVPQGRGTRWDVCRIEQGRIVPVNTVSQGR